MNYVPMDTGTISTNLSGTKDATSQEAKKDASSLRYIALLNWAHDALLEFTPSKPQDHFSTEVPEGSGNNPTTSISNPPVDQMKSLTVETPIPTVSSPVPTASSTDSQEPLSDARLISKRVANQEETPSLDNILSLTNRPIGTKWVLKNKKDERGIVIKNKVRLVAQGHTQEERIDSDKVFVPVARIEAIRLFLAYASFMGFTVYQMDVKSAFLYGTIDKEVYSDVRSSNTPMDKENPWRKDGTGKDVDLHLYRSMIESLIYLTASRPDIMFAVWLWYPKESLFALIAYSDSDYGGATQDCKSTTGGCQLLGRRLISWQCKKQIIMAASTTEAEYVAAASCCGQVLWIQNQLLDYGLSMPCVALTRDISSSILRFNTIMVRLQFYDYHNMVAILEKSEHNIDFHPMLDFIEASPLRIIPLFDTMLVQQGEGSGTPTEPHHTPSPEAQPPSHTTHSSSSLPPVTTTIPTVTPSETTPIREYTRRARIAQSFALPTVADEPKSPLKDISQREACPTDFGFIADQDRETIAKSSTLTHDSAQMVTSSAADEGNLEMMPQSRRRSLDEGEAAAERISDDSEEMKTVLTFMDATTVLAGGIADVPTGSRSIPTASPLADEVPTGSDVVPTASPVFATATMITPYRRRKGKEVMVKSETPKKQRFQEQIDAQVARELEEQLESEDQRRFEQIARDVKIARIHAEEELQIMIDGLDRNNETIAKYLQEYHQFASELPMERRIELISDLVKYQDNYAKVNKFQSQQRKPWTKKQKRDYYMVVIRSNLGCKVKYFRGMTFEEAKAKFNSVLKQLEDFIPMGSKEEAERIKRKGLSLEQESVKKQKISEEVTEEAKSSDEVPKEKVKEMMQLVPIEEVYVEALQVKHQIIDWKVYHKGQRSYLKITRLGGSSASYQFFIDLLKHLDRATDHLQNFMHAPIEWKLYESCGVHHVTSKDKEIFMLVEKDYPLRKGLALVMIGYNLQVENYSQMANDLILKIYKIANSLRQQVIEFPLAEEIPTASEESCHCQKKSEATAMKIALLLKQAVMTASAQRNNRAFKKINIVRVASTKSTSDPSDTLVLEVLGLDLVWQEK
nr:uncharacterized mitochondrial protein AtMg00810-like [Tanacetum cinerariifolium]